MKVACERAVLDGAASAMVIRPGLIVGPGDPSGRFSYWPRRLAAGGEVLAPGDPADRMQVIDVRDLAAWVVRLRASGGTTGVYDGVGPAMPLGDLLAQCAEGVGASPELVWTWVDQEFLTEHEVEPWMGAGAIPLWLPRPEYDGLMAHRFDVSADAGLTVRSSPTPPATPWPGCEHPDAARTGMSREREAEVLAAWDARDSALVDEGRLAARHETTAPPALGSPGLETVASATSRPRTAQKSSAAAGSSRIAATSARKREPFSPSTRRWSKDSASVVTCRTTISSPPVLTTHGFFRTAPKERIADSPGLMIGVPASTPKTPTLVIVNVPPLMSAGCVLPSRAVAVSSLSAAASSSSERSWASLTFGTTRPRAVAAAMPRLT